MCMRRPASQIAALHARMTGNLEVDQGRLGRPHFQLAGDVHRLEGETYGSGVEPVMWEARIHLDEMFEC